MFAWLQALFDESPMAIGFSRDGVMLDANPAYVRLFGYESAAEMRGRSILEQIAPSHRKKIEEMVALRARGGSPPQCYETRGRARNGTEFPFEITTTRVVVDEGPLTIAFITDISERAAAHDALSASEERFRTLSSAAFEGVLVHADDRIVLANEAGAAMLGFDAGSIVGASLMDLIAPESRDLVAEHVRRGSAELYEAVGRRRDGSTFVVEVRANTLLRQGRPTRVAILRDITERKRVEAEQRALAERVRHAQKLESLGVLAGGIAHDFNNVLTVISNSVALAQRDIGVSTAAGPQLESIALAAQRAADLCRQMLAYAGKASIAREVLDLSALVAEMSSMLEVSIAKKVTLARDLAPELPPILGDATQVRQIAMNLVLNASEAIAAPAGTVRIATGAGTYRAEELARSAAGGAPKAGAYAWLEVTDDGVGMDASTIANMFDPFFTTKFVGRGLGMAAVLGIVRGHAGAIDVASSPGKGTRVRVYFPASAGAREMPPRAPAAGIAGRGLVLVVDDERNVRVSTKILLEKLGFDVIVAGDGAEAIDVFRAQSGKVGAVLLDLTMPRMGGLETMKELRRIAPNVGIVLTSGYGTTCLDEDGSRSASAPDAVLAKPYAEGDLLRALDRVIRR